MGYFYLLVRPNFEESGWANLDSNTKRVRGGEGIDLQNFFFSRFLCSVFPALTFLLTSLEIEGVPSIKKRSKKTVPTTKF